jgi:hypothetical protein
MAIDVVHACSTASDSSGPQGFFVGMTLVFALYLALDTAIALLTIARKLEEHEQKPDPRSAQRL